MASAPSTDPGYVFKRVGIGLMAVAMVLAGGIVWAMASQGVKIENKYALIFLGGIVALPFLGGLALSADWFRDLLIRAADKLPFVNFQKSPPEPPANG